MTMIYFDHDAVRKAYPKVVHIADGDDSDSNTGAFEQDWTRVTLVQSNIDAARTTLNNEAAAVKYQTDRTGEIPGSSQDTVYPSLGDQLDLLYKDIVAGTITTSGGFATAIKATKDKYPKP